MRFFQPRTRWLLAALLAVPLVLFAAEFQIVKNARIPEYSEEGKLQTMVYAKTAKIPKKRGAKKALIEGLKIELYKNDEIDATIIAETCEYQRDTRVATSMDPVIIDTTEMHITGTEFVYRGADQQFVINRDVHVRLKNNKAFDVRPGDRKESKIVTPPAPQGTPAIDAPDAPDAPQPRFVP